jgi:hypothetical protein
MGNAACRSIPVVLAFALIIGGAAALQAQEASVAGDWELATRTQRGEVIWSVVFALSGETLEVTMTGPRGNSVKGTGTLKGDAIEWSIKVSTPRGEMDVVYKGIVTGDTMAGEVTRGTAGASEWSAKRKPAAS